VDNVDVGAAAERGVTVTRAPDYCTDEVAIHSVSLLLACLRSLKAYDDHVVDDGWSWEVGRPIRRVSASTVGFVSFGPIARRAAEQIAGFDADLVAYDPFVEADEMAEYGVEKADFDELFDRADHVGVYAPLTDATRGMVDADALARLDESSVVVNVSRGPVVDADALLDALESETIKGAPASTCSRRNRRRRSARRPRRHDRHAARGVVQRGGPRRLKPKRRRRRGRRAQRRDARWPGRSGCRLALSETARGGYSARRLQPIERVEAVLAVISLVRAVLGAGSRLGRVELTAVEAGGEPGTEVVGVAHRLGQHALSVEDDIDGDEVVRGGTEDEHLARAVVLTRLVDACDERFDREPTRPEVGERVASRRVREQV